MLANEKIFEAVKMIASLLLALLITFVVFIGCQCNSVGIVQ